MCYGMGMKHNPDVTQVVRQRDVPREAEPTKHGFFDAVSTGVKAFREAVGGKGAAGDLVGENVTEDLYKAYDFLFCRGDLRKAVDMLIAADITPEQCRDYVARPYGTPDYYFCPNEFLTANKIIALVTLGITSVQATSFSRDYMEEENNRRRRQSDPTRSQGEIPVFFIPEKYFKELVHKFTEEVPNSSISVVSVRVRTPTR